MTSRANKTVTTSLPQHELAEFDRVREAHHLTRSQAMREAIRQYVAAGTRRIPVVDPEPGELEAIARGEAAIARGEYVTLAEPLHEFASQGSSLARLPHSTDIAPLTNRLSTAMAAMVIDPAAFTSARHFAASIGLVPRQEGITVPAHAALLEPSFRMKV